MFEITDSLTINLEYISSISTQVDTTSTKSKENKYLTLVTPWLNISMTNGDKHQVFGLKDIYLFFDDPAVFKRKMWNNLISKVKSYLEKDNLCYLSEEDKEYLTRKI